MGEVLLFGIIIAIPVTIIVGPVFNKIAQNYPFKFTRVKVISQRLGSQKEFKESEMPGFGLSLFTKNIASDLNVNFNYCSINHWP